MARKYAVIMALVGMSVVLCRALKAGDGVEASVVAALQWMVILGCVGFVVAGLASAAIEDAVVHQMEQDLAASNPKRG